MKLSALLLVACFTGTALAEPEVDEDQPTAHRARVPLTVLEQLSLIIPPMAYYWSTTDVQAVDFDMDRDWGSWKRKLTSADAYILDTNDWESNATRHPLAGYLSYQIGRTNGFAPLGSVGMAPGTSALWESLGRDGIETKGGSWSAEDEEAFKAPIRQQYEDQGHPYYATARLWDDGVVDPAQTRRVLGLSLSASLNAPIAPTKFGLFRM